MSNMRIQGIEIYHPEKLVKNDYFIKKFREEQGKEIERLLIAVGRNERYFADDDPDENSLTMGYKAAKKVMESCNLTGDDIDLLIFSSQTPEYLCPANSVVLCGMLGLREDVQMFDQNLNCLGMVSATIAIKNMMDGNPNIKRALLIGSENFSAVCADDNEYTYPLMGDLACAVIYERTEDTTSGFIGNGTSLNDCSRALAYVRYPNNGIKKSFDDNVHDRKIYWGPDFEASFVPNAAKKLFDRYCETCNVNLNSIDHFCLSQFNYQMLCGVANALDVELDKCIYVGDKYGYTGTSSPFAALWYGINTGKIKHGDIIGLWSIGLYWTTSVILLRY